MPLPKVKPNEQPRETKKPLNSKTQYKNYLEQPDSQDSKTSKTEETDPSFSSRSSVASIIVTSDDLRSLGVRVVQKSDFAKIYYSNTQFLDNYSFICQKLQEIATNPPVVVDSPWCIPSQLFPLTKTLNLSKNLQAKHGNATPPRNALSYWADVCRIQNQIELDLLCGRYESEWCSRIYFPLFLGSFSVSRCQA